MLLSWSLLQLETLLTYFFGFEREVRDEEEGEKIKYLQVEVFSAEGGPISENRANI